MSTEEFQYADCVGFLKDILFTKFTQLSTNFFTYDDNKSPSKSFWVYSI